jgi:hypothetical protein
MVFWGAELGPPQRGGQTFPTCISVGQIFTLWQRKNKKIKVLMRIVKRFFFWKKMQKSKGY